MIIRKFSFDENFFNYSEIDYFLDPTKIKIVPKTVTLKHYQHQLFTWSDSSEESIFKQTSPGQCSVSSLRCPNKTAATTPFELTICVQVNLPFNQKTAVRVKKEMSLSDLFVVICREANLHAENFELRVGGVEPTSMEASLDQLNTKQVDLVLKKPEVNKSDIHKIHSGN